MPDPILPNGPSPSPSPELPLTLSVDGNLGAVDFITRLQRGGLTLRNADDGSSAVIVLAEGEEPLPVDDPQQPERGIRAQLFQVSGVVYAVRFALEASDHVEIDVVQLASALEVAGRMIDDVASQLEGHDHG